MIAEPVNRDFVVPQGVTYQIRMRWVDGSSAPIALTGATVRAQLRQNYDTSSISIDCTLINGKAFLDSDGWYFGFNLLPADTNAIDATTYVYDIVVTTAGGDITRAMQGKISLTPSVTRE
jgi:hypothetical protein